MNDWGGGFQAEISLTNDQTPISSWELEFDFANQITQIWNAMIVSQTGTHYVVGNAPWNGSLAPGASTNFGFLGTPGNVGAPPESYVVNGVVEFALSASRTNDYDAIQRATLKSAMAATSTEFAPAWGRY